MSSSRPSAPERRADVPGAIASFLARRGITPPGGAPTTERIPTYAGTAGYRVLRDWLAGFQRGLPAWEDLRTDAQRYQALERMMADDAVKAAFLTKLFSVSSLDWQMHPATPDDPRSRQVADFHLYNLQRSRGGTRALVEALLFPGLVRGYSVCELKVREQPEQYPPWAGKRCLAEVKSKPHVYLEEDPYGNVVALMASTTAGLERFNPADGFVWFKFLPLFGAPTSDFRAAYRAFCGKCMVIDLWLIGLEKFGQPFFRGTYQSQTQKAELETALASIRRSTYITIPDGSAVEPVEILGGNHAYYQQALDACDKAIFTAIAGAMLQNTVVSQPSTDMRGSSTVQRSTAELFVWNLAAAIADTTNDQIVPYFNDLNFLNAAPPRATLGGVNDNDLLPSAQLDQLLTQIGLPLSKKERYIYYGRTPPADEGDALTGPPKPEGPPGGGGGGLPFSEGGATAFNDCVSEKISKLMHEGYEQRQAIAIASKDCGQSNQSEDPCGPFAGARTADEFCQSGPNAGKPGPCPKGKQGPPRPPRPSPAEMTAHVKGLLAGGIPSPEA